MSNQRKALSIWELYRQQPRIMLAEDHGDDGKVHPKLCELDFLLTSADLVRAHGMGLDLIERSTP